MSTSAPRALAAATRIGLAVDSMTTLALIPKIDAAQATAIA
jgi:hypothetical protein